MPHGHTVYILDDDAPFREDLTEFLEGEGYKVGATGDPRYLSESELNHYDVLLLDLALPAIDGVEVLKHLALLPHMPQVILISGAGEDVIRTVADAARRDHVRILGALRKPFDPSELLSLLLAKEAATDTPIRPARDISAAEILPALIAAIEAHTLQVAFQPKVKADSLAFAGAEALLGNSLPGYGPVFPYDIIKAASSAGLLTRLTHEVLRAAVHGCEQWRAAGWDGVVSVNLPLDVVLEPGAVDAMAAIVHERGLAASSVMFELTEDQRYDSSSNALNALARLRLAGFGLALDDVGQRQSGLLQLVNLPVTEIKIDLEILHQARAWGKAKNIFGSLADIGRRLGVSVVAEGVETEDDLQLVRANGVAYVQGFLVSGKRPLDEFLAVLGTRKDIDAKTSIPDWSTG